MLTASAASAIFDAAFRATGRKTLYWDEKDTAVRALMEGREAYLSRFGSDNNWAFNCARYSMGAEPPVSTWPMCRSLREWIDWDSATSHRDPRVLEERLGWIVPLNEAAANALCAEYARLGTFREAVTTAPGWDGRYIDARGDGWAA